MNALAEALSFSSGPRTDTELVSACLSGDQEAWSELVDRYSRLIYSIPLRQGLSREDAADVYQAVCLDLVAELPKLRDPQALQAWLIRTTVRKAGKWRRRNERFVPDEGGLADTADETEPLPDSLWDELGIAHGQTFTDQRHLVIYGQRTADNRFAFGAASREWRCLENQSKSGR